MLNVKGMTRAQKKGLKELGKILYGNDTKFDFEPLESHPELIEKEWVEVDETEIPEQMVNTGVLHEIYCSRWYDALNTVYIPNDWYDDRYIDGCDWYIDDWDEI